MKRCTKCLEEKELEAGFYRNEVYKGGYQSQCKVCCNKAKKIRIQRHKSGRAHNFVETVSESEINRLLRTWRQGNRYE